MIRRVVLDAEIDLGDLEEGIEVRGMREPLDPVPWAPHEVLLVSGDAERLAEAAELGLNRLVVGAPGPTAAAIVELCRELDRP